MRLSAWGGIARACWLEIPPHFPLARLDASFIMPNHLHRVPLIGEAVVGAAHGMTQQPPQPGTASSMATLITEQETP